MKEITAMYIRRGLYMKRTKAMHIRRGFGHQPKIRQSEIRKAGLRKGSSTTTSNLS